MTYRLVKRHFLLVFCLLCAACADIKVQGRGVEAQSPSLQHEAFIAADGHHLPAQWWLPAGKPKAVVIALHGMNDYSHAFHLMGESFRKQQVAVLAYDQRGFGATTDKGIWAGEDNLVADLRDATAAVKLRYPHTPVYVLGLSMGGAVAIATFARADAPAVDGVILVAPAVWGGDAMNPLYRASLWSLAHIMPDKILTGEKLNIVATDNIALLREMWHDPLVQKRTRVDSVLGLVRLMDAGNTHLHELRVPLLLLYGQRDQVIPPDAIADALRVLPRTMTLAYYPEGYHLLLGDLTREIPYRDILSWIEDKQAALPSGYDAGGERWLGAMAKKLVSGRVITEDTRILK